jgi:hypothetical protein
MIDSIIILPGTHRMIGEIVLLITLLTALLLLYQTIRKQAMSRLGRAMTIAAQLALMMQALIGIKLLDQGMGTVQLYIHYVGGLGPLLFFLLSYWFPAKNPIRHTRWTALAAVGAFTFAIMAYTIGGMYARGDLS